MRDEILKLLKESEVPLTELNIQDKLSEKVSLDKLCEELRTMEKCGDLYVTKKGKYTVYENTHLKVGKLSVSKKGFGFVIMENEPDIHIKKENIGLIEVMGLAVLPARLKKEMAELEHRILNKENLWESDLTKSHAEWAEKWMPNYEITEENIHAIVQKEIGIVFAKVLECAGVYKRTPEGKAAFQRFLDCI